MQILLPGAPALSQGLGLIQDSLGTALGDCFQVPGALAKRCQVLRLASAYLCILALCLLTLRPEPPGSPPLEQSLRSEHHAEALHKETEEKSVLSPILTCISWSMFVACYIFDELFKGLMLK